MEQKSQLRKDLSELKSQIEELTKKINVLITDVKDIKNSCSHMDEHITFVEDTYSSVRHPLNYIFSKISGQTTPLPAIENSKDAAVKKN